MDDYKDLDAKQRQKYTTFDERFRAEREDVTVSEHDSEHRIIDAKDIAERLTKEKESKQRTQKWVGRGLIFLGTSIVMPSCLMYSVSGFGVATIATGLALLLSGTGLLAWKPKLKDTNEALLVAVKHGNYLTVPRLALEMDISFEKAEKIIAELVRKGIAEIDFDRKEPDNVIVYKVKGL